MPGGSQEGPRVLRCQAVLFVENAERGVSVVPVGHKDVIPGVGQSEKRQTECRGNILCMWGHVWSTMESPAWVR